MNGRTTLEIGDGVRYEGRLSHGKRKGQGTLYVDEGYGRTSALRVRWDDDVPQGAGSFLEPDGGRVVGTWRNGELVGLAHEEHPDGTLRFLGHFVGGQRNGDGIEVRLDGGCLVGTWADGAMHGPRCAYLYPCRYDGMALVGEWRHGHLHRAHPARMRPEAISEALGRSVGGSLGGGVAGRIGGGRPRFTARGDAGCGAAAAAATDG